VCVCVHMHANTCNTTLKQHIISLSLNI